MSNPDPKQVVLDMFECMDREGTRVAFRRSAQPS